LHKYTFPLYIYTIFYQLFQAKKGAVQKEMGSPNYFKFTSEFKSAKI